ncbi:hypothetical protein FKM82_021923 [Ascaphus truei]
MGSFPLLLRSQKGSCPIWWHRFGCHFVFLYDGIFFFRGGGAGANIIFYKGVYLPITSRPIAASHYPAVPLDVWHHLPLCIVHSH